MQIQMVTFSAAKDGNAPGEWQDGACGGVVSDGTGAPRRARFVVLDGATGAYDPVRWVDQLVRSFAPQARPEPRDPGSSPPRCAPGSPRCRISGPRTCGTSTASSRSASSPRSARSRPCSASRSTGSTARNPTGGRVALGDTVLFHVRAGRLIAAFPPMGPEDFGTLPDGVHTSPASLDRMTERLLVGGGVLEAGDFLFAATDAMAQWILRTIERDEAKVWDTLTTLAHPDVFARLVEDQRREQNSAKRMKNDDVTLMRLRMLAGQPAYLLACR